MSDPTPVHRSRLICNPIQILGGRSVSLNTFKQDFQVFQERANEIFRKQMKKGNMTKAKLHLLCMAFLQPTSITFYLLIPFWKIIYQMLSAEWCARLCQDWRCRHHWGWSERHLTVLVNNFSTWVKKDLYISLFAGHPEICSRRSKELEPDDQVGKMFF